MTPPEKIPKDKMGTIDGYLMQVDPDQLALVETLTAYQEIYESSRVFYESLKDDDITAWELFWLITQVWVNRAAARPQPGGVRRPRRRSARSPGEYDGVERFDPAIIVSTLKGEPLPDGYGEQLAQRCVGAVRSGRGRRRGISQRADRTDLALRGVLRLGPRSREPVAVGRPDLGTNGHDRLPLPGQPGGRDARDHRARR